MMRMHWRRALLAALLVAACGGPATTAPLSASVGASPAPTSAAPSVVPTSAASETAAIEALVASMADAVRARDRAAYLALVDRSDPVFALEHGRWADEWAGPKPVSDYTLAVSGLAVQGQAATGLMSVHWQLAGGDEARIATYAVTFARSAAGWRYAGERWVATDAPHFRVLVAPGLEATVPAIVGDLPAVYDHVTSALGVVPGVSMQIKEYLDSDALGANTLLSLPPIRGWNEPGEALKLRADPAIPSDKSVIAHEFTHFVLFDRAGTHRTKMPWWLDEGVASYVASSFEGADATDRLAQVIAWETAGELATWGDMAVFETTPLELWQFVYPQGYAMVRFVTETYGVERRNAWLAAMATEMDIDHATPAVLGLSFGDLDAGFRGWLRAR